jgi:hypothetical protein
MGTQKLCACDGTSKSLISKDVVLVDTVKLPFAELVNDLSEVTHDVLWLNPFRGIPRGPRLSRFDVIYLDEDCRVLELVENFAEVEFAPIGDALSLRRAFKRAIGSGFAEGTMRLLVSMTPRCRPTMRVRICVRVDLPYHRHRIGCMKIRQCRQKRFSVVALRKSPH